jgi:phosphoglycerate dehydrogenase-like enzyme
MKKIDSFYNVTLPDNRSNDLILSEIKDAKYVISGATHLGEEHFQQAPFLKAVVLPSAGYEDIDIKSATKHNVYVINTPGANSNAVAEMAFGLLLAAARHIVQANNRVKRGEWVNEDIRNELLGYELTGKTLGITGLGYIGTRIDRITSGFLMKILCYTQRPSPERAEQYGVHFVSLDELMRTADCIAICCSLNPQTTGLIGAEQIKLMKETVFLINTARGKVVDYDALYKALKDKNIAGAGIDVLYEEPPGATHPFFGLDNVITTPHLGSRTRDSAEKVTNMVVDEIIRLEKGHKPN